MALTTVNPALLDTQAQYTGFKNRIINGAMVIDQRNAGASFTVGNLGYGIDRWLTQAVTVSGTGQQVTGSTGNNKALRITGASGNTAIQVSQRIESVNVYDCANQTITVSFTLSGSASGSVSVRFLYPTATDNYTSTTEPVAGTTVNFTTTATQYSVTRTLDSNANKGVWVLLDFGAVGAGVTRTLEFFQLEKGSTATSFDYRPYGTELALCQRYYWRLSANSNGTNIAIGSSANSTVASFAVKTPVTMRATPTMSFSTLVVDDGGTVSSVSSLISISSFVNADVIAFNTSGGSTLTTGRAGRLIANTAGTSFLDFSIEL